MAQDAAPTRTADEPVAGDTKESGDTAVPMGKVCDSAAATPLRKQLAVCLFYGCTSVSITFFNKAVFSVYKFRYPCILTLLQITFCIAALSAANTLKMYVCVTALPTRSNARIGSSYRHYDLAR